MIWRLTLRHLLSKPFSAVLTLVAICASISLLGVFWALVENMDRVQVSSSITQGGAKETASLTLYLESKLSRSQIENFQQELSRYPELARSTVVPPQEALKDLEKQFGETLSRVFQEDMLPVTLRVELASKTIERGRYMSLLNELRLKEGVVDLDDGMALLGSVDPANSSQSRLFTWANTLLIMILLVTALMISHIIRIAFENTRAEVESMKILGAPRHWIFLPMLLEGLFFGVAGSLAAIITSQVAAKWLLPQFGANLLPAGITFSALSAGSTLSLLGVGVGAALVGALMSWPLVQQGPQEA